jgi:hypothetical protein
MAVAEVRLGNAPYQPNLPPQELEHIKQGADAWNTFNAGHEAEYETGAALP